MKKEEIDEKYDPSNLFIKSFKYDKWYKICKEESKSQLEETIAKRVKADDEDLSNMSPLEDDEEKVKLEPEETIAERVKLNPRERKNEGKGLKILTPNKLLTKRPILLAQIKSGKNSYRLKTEITKILYLLYQHNEHTI